MKITRFEDIEAWKSARLLCREIYTASKSKTWDSDRDLMRQIRKAAVSTMANIAEGFDSGTDIEFRRFLRIGWRSTAEIQSHLYVALDQEYLRPEAFDSLYKSAADVKGLIGGFVRYLTQSKRNKKSSS